MGAGLVFLSFWGRMTGKGKCIGKSLNGIKVFRKIAKNGDVVTTSYKNGKLFKTITKQKEVKNVTNAFVPYSSVGHRTVAVNHETGVSTIINKSSVTYKKAFNQYGTDFAANTVRNEYSVERSIHPTSGWGRFWGKSYERMESPGFLREYKGNHFNGQQYFASETCFNGYSTRKYVAAHDYKMPNGNTVTGEWARTIYPNGETRLYRDFGDFKPHNLSMTQQANGTYHIERM